MKNKIYQPFRGKTADAFTTSPANWSANQNIPPYFIFVIAGSLIFFSIVPYAGINVWTEAIVLTVIFALGAVAACQPNFGARAEIKLLLAPIAALALFSFAQGLFTLFVRHGWLQASAALPDSFDLTASFWCALKFLALAVFIKIILSGSRRQIEFLIWSLIITGNFFAVLGIVRFVAQENFPDVFQWFVLPELRPGIGFGTFINQNHFAFLMLMNLGLNIGVCVGDGLAKNARRWLFLFCLITWTAIILTASRGGIISSLIVIAVSILLPLAAFVKNKRRDLPENQASYFAAIGKRLAVAALLLVALIFGIAFIGQDRVVGRFEEISSELAGATDAHGFRRIDVWRAAMPMFDEHPFYGVGFGGFRYAVAQYADISGAVEPREAHNDYLELAASGGAAAGLCGIWFLYGFTRTLKKRFAAVSNCFLDAARTGAVSAIAGIAVHSFFDFGLQLIGNWLYFAAVLSIAVHCTNTGETGNNGAFAAKFSRRKLNAVKFSGAIFGLCLGAVSLWFGFSRLENSLARDAADDSFVKNDFIKIPFDGDFYQSRGFINIGSGNFAGAANDLQEAIRYRPKDYALHLKLAEVRSSQNELNAAESSFREAVRLAPRYAAPRFYLGIRLIAANRRTEGFGELHRAFQSNPRYFEAVLRLAWRETNGDPDETTRLLSPLAAAAKEKLAAFFLDQKHYAAAVALFCGDPEFTGGQRDILIQKLFEKRQFLFASQIHRRDCDSPHRGEISLTDGDFETGDLRENLGFGWRVGEVPAAIKIGFDEAGGRNHGSSLGLIFSGSAAPSLTVLSQTVVVGKKQRYQFSFAYRTEDIKTGGAPVVQLILKQPEVDVMLREIKLTANDDGWSRISTTIRTNEQTDAVEIRLTRQPCSESLCPIYGRLWLDDFVIE